MSDTVLKRRAMPNVAPVLQLGFTMRLQKIGLNVTLLAGLVLLAVVILVAIAAPLLSPYDPIVQKLDEGFLPPLSPNHILVTDNFVSAVCSRIALSTLRDLPIRTIS